MTLPQQGPVVPPAEGLHFDLDGRPVKDHPGGLQQRRGGAAVLEGHADSQGGHWGAVNGQDGRVQQDGAVAAAGGAPGGLRGRRERCRTEGR